MLILFAASVVLALIRPGGCEATDNWEAYLEYRDLARKVTFTCYYDKERIAQNGQSDTIMVWEKLVPQGVCLGEWGRAEGKVLDETTNLLELDCTEKRVRVIEAYSEYEDNVVVYSLEPSPWLATSVGSREDQLLHVACGSARNDLAPEGTYTERQSSQ
jgi:hypothetical protein